MKIATFNVNGVNGRLAVLLRSTDLNDLQLKSAETLATLRERGVTGAVLAPRSATGNGSAFAPSPHVDLPEGAGAQPVRRHVRARHGEAVAESVLDALIGHAVRVDGWEEAIDLSLERDDLIVVTPEGDRFAATGWRVRSSTSVVTAAAVEEAQRRSTEAAAPSGHSDDR